MSAATFASIDLSKIAFSPAKKLEKGGYVSYVNAAPGEFRKVSFQLGDETHPLVAPYGISEPYDPDQATNKRNFELSINSPEMLKFFKDLDELVIKTVTANSHIWFANKKSGGPLTEEQVRSIYIPLVKDDNPDYEPSVKTKVIVEPKATQQAVQIWEQIRVGNKMGRRLVNSQENPKFYQAVGKHCSVVPYVEIGGLYMMSKNFSLTLTTTHIMKMAAEAVPEFPFQFANQANFAPLATQDIEMANADDDIRSEAPEVYETMKHIIQEKKAASVIGSVAGSVVGIAPHAPAGSTVNSIAPFAPSTTSMVDGNIDDDVADPMNN